MRSNVRLLLYRSFTQYVKLVALLQIITVQFVVNKDYISFFLYSWWEQQSCCKFASVIFVEVLNHEVISRPKP